MKPNKSKAFEPTHNLCMTLNGKQYVFAESRWADTPGSAIRPQEKRIIAVGLWMEPRQEQAPCRESAGT